MRYRYTPGVMVLPGIIAVVLLVAAVRVWVRWARNRYSIADLFELPWWTWPLARLMIRQWKHEAHKDLWEACGMVSLRTGGPQFSHGYITVSGWQWVAWRKATVLGRKVPYAWRLQRRPRVPWVRIRVARGFPQGDEDIPPGEKDPKKEVINNARGTLDLGPVDYKWHWRFVASYVVLTPREVVPKVAPGMAPDVAAVVAKNLAADTVVPAIGKGDRPITHSTTADASHVLMSGTTMGGGKSETLKTFGLQSYAPSILSGRNIEGADLLIVDTTRKFSHTGWAVDFKTGDPWPGIVIATELDEAASYLTLASQAMEQRGEITRQAKIRGETVDWSRLLIMLDDSNGLHKQLKDHGYKDALTAISMLLWHARGVNMYLIAAYQRGSANAAGGGDNREAFGCRIWSDGSEKTGDMLADAVDRKTRPTPKPHKVQAGHAVFIYGSLAFEAQRILYTDDEAHRVCRTEASRRQRLALPAAGWMREIASPHPLTSPKGRGHGPESQTLPATTESHPRPPQAPVNRFSLSPDTEVSVQAIGAISQIDEVDGEINYVTLREVASRDWCPTYHSIRTYANPVNDYDFPDPIEGFSNPRRWSERAVREWVEDFHAQGGAKDWGVYFALKPGDATAKIGFTGNLKARLRKWNFHKDWVRRWIPCGSKREAMAMETKMHRDYHACHEELEWFRVYDHNGDLTRLGRDLGLPEVVRS